MQRKSIHVICCVYYQSKVSMFSS